MANEPNGGRSRRVMRLTDKFRNKRYRDSYVDANVRRFLAQQIRALRGDLSQEAFGKLLDKPQSVVSRLEDPSYGKFSLQTLLEIAASLDRAVIARIVDFPTFLRFTEDVSEAAISPAGYDEHALDRFSLGLPQVVASASASAPLVVAGAGAPLARGETIVGEQVSVSNV
jgi:hypothetical protein